MRKGVISRWKEHEKHLYEASVSARRPVMYDMKQTLQIEANLPNLLDYISAEALELEWIERTVVMDLRKAIYCYGIDGYRVRVLVTKDVL